MIKIDRKHLQDLESALGREWLETNGLGGYASSTVVGINTRKYHGLLIAAMRPPVDRLMLVSRVDEALLVGDARFELAASEYADTIYPDGFRYLDEVRLDPFPVFTYIVGGVRLQKSIFMVHGENTTVVQYRVEPLPNGPAKSRLRLEVRPLVAFRSHHLVMKENPDFDRSVRASPGRISLMPYRHMPALHVAFGAGTFQSAGYWYRNFHYRREEEQGYPHGEDLYSPGALTFAFADGDSPCVVFSTSDGATADPGLAKTEIERRARLRVGSGGTGQAESLAAIAGHRLGRHLVTAADAFIVRRGEHGRTIIAGYPWFPIGAVTR